MTMRRFLTGALAALIASAGVAKPVALQVSAVFSPGAAVETRQIDLAELQALQQASLTTQTIWTDRANTYSGVLLQDFVAHLGALGDQVHLVALDGYEVTIPLDEIGPEGPLLAYMLNGQPMTLRQRGPLWLIYPFDSHPQYRNEETYGRAIWHVVALSIGD